MAEALSAKPQIAIIVSSSFYTIWNLFPGFVIPRPFVDNGEFQYGADGLLGISGILDLDFLHHSLEIYRTGQMKQFNNFFTNYFGFRHDFVGIVAVVVGLQ
ncbi:hypothetical protein WN943_021135 [Citrus x changshan-huyou]